MHRRMVLTGAGLALTCLAGCLGQTDGTGQTGTPEENSTATPRETDTPTETATPDSGMDPEELDGYVRPDDDPQAIPEELVCDDEEFERHGQPFETFLWGGDAETFALRVSDLDVAYGDSVRIELTNISSQREETGNRNKWNLQVRTEAGWQNVRGTTEPNRLEYTDEAIAHEPGEGFRWELTLAEEGVVADHVHDDLLYICPDLPVGRYRFVFFGAPAALAIAFDVTE